MNAQDILEAGIRHMMDRAATYDKPQGERSMAATVEAFRAVSGVAMTEEQGWLFMLLLKAVRSQQGAYRADSYEDGAAYFALAGECAYNTRRQEERHPMTPNVVSYPAMEFGVDTRFDQSGRQEVVEQNGNDALAYSIPKDATHYSHIRGDFYKLDGTGVPVVWLGGNQKRWADCGSAIPTDIAPITLAAATLR